MEVWQIIFLSKWVTFRFQPLIFPGVSYKRFVSSSWGKVSTLHIGWMVPTQDASDHQDDIRLLVTNVTGGGHTQARYHNTAST